MSADEKKNALVEVGCAYWFNDNDRGRSPFPKEIQPDAKRRAQDEYLNWLGNLTDDEAEEVDDDEMASIFEGFLFGEALKLIDGNDTDLALTLNFPFMPRVGDLVNDEKRGESRVIQRTVEPKKDNKPFMLVILEAVDSKETWQTEFMLPD